MGMLDGIPHSFTVPSQTFQKISLRTIEGLFKIKLFSILIRENAVQWLSKDNQIEESRAPSPLCSVKEKDSLKTEV